MNLNQKDTNFYIKLWLKIGMILVLTMVIIGGITRLTQSGLSMVHWKPLHFLPPLNHTQWQEEFTAYQASPEFRHFNSHFSLSDFKQIYFWEYLHRLIGRIMGLVFLFPFLYFYVTKKIQSKRLLIQLLVLFAWGGLQGFLGWYMVKSGLVDNPHVSHYRLAIHLLTAFTMVSYMYGIVLELKYDKQAFTGTQKTAFPVVLYFLVLLQITYGAFTAGLKAGYLYSTYPLMQNRFFPLDARTALQQNGLISFFENHALVQFVHRWLGFSLALLVVIFYIKYYPKISNVFQKRATQLVLALVFIQFLLGILTLIFHVPIVLAVLHQLTATLLLLSFVKLWFFSFRKV